MDEEELKNAFKRFAEASLMMIRAYDLIGDLLERLPLSIAIPRFDDPENWESAQAVPAIIQARAAAGDEPMPPEVRFTVDRMLLDWLTAYEVACMVDNAGPAPWRTDAMVAATVRVTVALNRAAAWLIAESGGEQ